MSDSKKYYYLKLKDNYFDQDNIKILESMNNGHIYSLIILKLLLKSIKHNGRLMMTESIPYDPGNIETLASVINHDTDHVKEALKNAMKLDLLIITSSQELWMSDIQNFIGTSSSEADRKRRYRKLLSHNDLPIEITDGTNVRQMSDKHPPEIEIEIERDIEIKKECLMGQMSQSKEKDFFNNSDNDSFKKHKHDNDTIQKVIHYSSKMKGIPTEKRIIINIETSELMKIKDSLAFYTQEEIRKGFDNYEEIYKNRNELYSMTPYKSMISFLINGIGQYVDESNPFELFKKNNVFNNNDDNLNKKLSRIDLLELKEQAGELKEKEIIELEELRG